jgi:hypothetical protein
MVVGAVPATAEPDEREVTFRKGMGIRLDFDLSSVIEVTSRAREPEVTNITLASGHLSLSMGRPHIRYFGSFDLALGATVENGGFGGDVAFLPIGVGFQLRRPENTAFLGIAAGVGVNGAPSALPLVGTAPVQLISTLRLGENLNLLVRGRLTWFITSARDDGPPSSATWDELEGTVALQLSKSHNYLEGHYFGVAYRELQGARFVGIVIGSGAGEEIFDE